MRHETIVGVNYLENDIYKQSFFVCPIKLVKITVALFCHFILPSFKCDEDVILLLSSIATHFWQQHSRLIDRVSVMMILELFHTNLISGANAQT